MSLAVSYRGNYRGFNISAPGANTNAFTPVVWPSDRMCRVAIQVAVATVVNFMVTRGGATIALGLNSNAVLTAGALHGFNVPGLAKDDEVTVQVETDSAIPLVAFDEVL